MRKSSLKPSGIPLPPVGHRLDLILGTVTLVQVLATMAMLSVAVVAPMVALSIGVGAHLVGYQVGLTYVFCASSAAISGGLVKRWGPCRVSQTALLMARIGPPGPSLGGGGGAAVVNDHWKSAVSGLPARSVIPEGPPVRVAV